MLSRFALVALACGLLPVVHAETECVWRWRALGCTPSKECKLKWAPGFGTFGPCVLRKPKETGGEAKAAAEEPPPAAAAETAPPVEEPAAETASSSDAPEKPADAPEEPSEAAAKAEL